MIRFIPTPLLLFAMTEACAQASQSAPVAVPMTDLGGSLWQLLFGLAAVLALMIGSLWVLKKLVAKRGESAGLLRVVAGTAVGTRERVVIVEVGSTWLVLGVAPGRVSALAEVPRQSVAAQPVSPDSSSGAGFSDWLRKLTQGK
ncbi:MAG: flagellar biosynthetic protein FliO [Sulfuritalea sp.]|jgi:flagellar protein FliO/FliZ|nr:flagellar biosynthetic protein FliO [Sulfuritalea sp.]